MLWVRLSIELENRNVVQKTLTGENVCGVLISKYLELDKGSMDLKWETSFLCLQKPLQNSFRRLNTLEFVPENTCIDLHEEGKTILWSNSVSFSTPAEYFVMQSKS